jgi:hypothetical protein
VSTEFRWHTSCYLLDNGTQTIFYFPIEFSENSCYWSSFGCEKLPRLFLKLKVFGHCIWGFPFLFEITFISGIYGSILQVRFFHFILHATRVAKCIMFLIRPSVTTPCYLTNCRKLIEICWWEENLRLDQIYTVLDEDQLLLVMTT